MAQKFNSTVIYHHYIFLILTPIITLYTYKQKQKQTNKQTNKQASKQTNKNKTKEHKHVQKSQNKTKWGFICSFHVFAVSFPF